MSVSEDAFLRDFQDECIKGGGDHFSSMRAALLTLQSTPKVSLSAFLKVTHNMKGNLQAVGFSYCAEMVNRFETILTEINGIFENSQNPLQSSDFDVLEFMLSNVIETFDGYFKKLKTTYIDSDEFVAERKDALDVLAAWSSEIAKTDAVPPVSEEKLEPKIVVVPELEPELKKEEVEDTEIESNFNELQKLYLLCQQGTRYFGVPIKNVVEIVEWQGLNKFPDNRNDLLGYLNLRGEALPIMNFSDTFSDKKGCSEKSKKGYIIVAQVQGERFGFEVQDAKQVIPLFEKSFQRADLLAEGGHGLGLVKYISLTDEKTILILDLDGTLAA